MRAVEVTPLEYDTLNPIEDSKFYIADSDGNGWHKVMIEGGGPHWGHKSVTCAEVLSERTKFDANDCHCVTAGGR